MPKKGNYNHDYYKVRGKEPGNQDVLTEVNREEYGEARRKTKAKGVVPAKKKTKTAMSRKRTPSKNT